VNVSYTYDADGRLVKRWDGQTTVYVGDLYQRNLDTGQVTKYYYLGQRRVAVRIGGTPYWLLVDQLGSTMVVLNSSGSKVGEKWYYPFGEERYSSSSLFVERRFTSQRWDGTIGLYDYKARYYDPALGRFVQPDTIVPEAGNPQALNRYSYVYNNPVRYTDPSGRAICADEDCSVVFGPHQRSLIRRGPEAYYWSQNGLQMVWDWFTESGSQTRYYGASARMTRDLMRDEGVQQAREQFYLTGEPKYRITLPIRNNPFEKQSNGLPGRMKQVLALCLEATQCISRITVTARLPSGSKMS